MLNPNLVTLRDPSWNPNVSSLKYNLNAKCAYHFNSARHDTDQCWTLKCKIQDLIDNKTIEFDPPTTLNIITAPMPNHGKGVNAIEDTAFVSSVEDLTTPLTIVKENLLRVGVFPGCLRDCCCCAKKVYGCKWLKKGVQHLIDSHEILFERSSSIKSLTEFIPQEVKDISIINISNKPLGSLQKVLLGFPINRRLLHW